MKKILSVIIMLVLVLGTNIYTIASSEPTPTPNKGIVGGRLILTKLCVVHVTFIKSDASYNNAYGLFAPSKKSLGYGHSTNEGKDFNLGSFKAGTELIFYIKNDLSQTFYSGNGSKNEDKVIHASYKKVSDSKWYLGFEDTNNGGDKDYNDIELYVWTSTSGSAYILPPGCTPRPIPTPTKWKIDIQ